MKKAKYLLLCCFFSASAFALQWVDLWQTKDQQGSHLFKMGDARGAAKVFKNKSWQGAAHYRAGNYQEAYKKFTHHMTSDGQYNAGNAAAFMARYQDAIKAYDQAIALNPKNQDAIDNREIVKRLLQEEEKQKQPQKSASKQKNQEQENQKNSQASKEQQQKNPLNNAQNQKNQSSQKQQHQQQDHQTQEQQQAESSDKRKQPQTSQKQDDNVNTQRPKQKSLPQQAKKTKDDPLLRRLSDDPGSLLQRKFLRDYMRRHGEQASFDQGMM